MNNLVEIFCIYLLRGLLYHKCLLTVLKRRHNVNYGTLVNNNKIKVRTKLAVPYRAKSVPSERSEYSHPDIAILLEYTFFFNFHQSNLNQPQNFTIYLFK